MAKAGIYIHDMAKDEMEDNSGCTGVGIMDLCDLVWDPAQLRDPCRHGQ